MKYVTDADPYLKGDSTTWKTGNPCIKNQEPAIHVNTSMEKFILTVLYRISLSIYVVAAKLSPCEQ